MTVNVFSDRNCLLGEGPVWDEGGRRLWWVDIKSSQLHSQGLTDSASVTWKQPARPSAVALCADISLIVAYEDGVYHWISESNQRVLLTTLNGEPKSNRNNDGKWGVVLLRLRWWTKKGAHRHRDSEYSGLDIGFFDLLFGRFKATNNLIMMPIAQGCVIRVYLSIFKAPRYILMGLASMQRTTSGMPQLSVSPSSMVPIHILPCGSAVGWVENCPI
jgi:hypothetical protein